MNNATILVVDDEPQLRRVMLATLTDLGYVVMTATSGEEALAFQPQPTNARASCNRRLLGGRSRLR